MNNILIIYAETQKNMSLADTIKSFTINCTDINLAQKTMCFSYNQDLIELPKDIDYIVYIPNDCIFNEQYNYISSGIEIINNDKNTKQVCFCNYYFNYGNKYDFDDKYNKHEKIKNILKDQQNKYQYKIPNLDMTLYAQHMYPSYQFNLLPSIIKVNDGNLVSITFPINVCSTEYFKFRQLYENSGYGSYYLNKNLVPNALNQSIKLTVEPTKKLIDNITIVTGFINVNAAVKKKLYDYVEKSIPTLSIQQYMVIYVSHEIKEHVINIRTQLGLMDKTKIIEITLEDLYMYDNIDKMKECAQKNISPYDNHLYVMSVNSRYNYMKRSIENNYFNTDYFAWIDFGISHIVEMNKVTHVMYNTENKIKIAWIARYRSNENKFAWNHIAMGGGFFMGHKKAMLEYIKLHDIEFRNMMNFGHCVNDDRLVYLMFEKYPELFDFYFSSYSHLILKSF